MAKRAHSAATATQQHSVTPRSKWKILFSVLIVVHLLAIVAEPFAFFTRGANSVSPAALPIRANLAPYVEFAYLNHGYFFFAPNPGPSHLLECQLTTSSCDQSRLRLPDRRAQWPRLLYHRHFMLAEFLHQLHVPPITAQVEATTPDKDLLAAWKIERSRFEMVRDSMIKHLKTRYGAQSAEISRLEHRLPNDIEVFRDKIQLSDERLYAVLPDAPLDTLPTSPQPIAPQPMAPLQITPQLNQPAPEQIPNRSVEIPKSNVSENPSANEQSPP